MRINSISPNFYQRSNVKFGRFADENARKVVEEALMDENESHRRLCSGVWFRRIEKCEYLDVYTTEDGTVKAKFDDEFVKNSTEGMQVRIGWLKEDKNLEDLSDFDNIEDVSAAIRCFDEIITGVDPRAEWAKCSTYEEPEDYAAMRAIEEAYR